MNANASLNAQAALPAIGSKGTYSGFPATVVGHYYEMVELRVPGGVTCVSPSLFIEGGQQ